MSDEQLIAAAIRTLRFLESYGTGKLAKVPAAVDLREAIIAATGQYVSAAEEMEAEFTALRVRLAAEVAEAESGNPPARADRP